jgi:hypothetical protein
MNSTSAAEFQKQMFTRLDKNGDGSLDQAEFESGTKGAGSNVPAGLDPKKLFSEIDTSGDGKISEAESAAFGSKMEQKMSEMKGANPGGMGRPAGMPPDGGQKQSSATAGASGSTSKSGATSKTYDPKDTNKDGTVSVQEETMYDLTHPEWTKSSQSKATGSGSGYDSSGRGYAQKVSSLLDVVA